MAGKTSGQAATKQPYVNPLESLTGIGRSFAREIKRQVVDEGIKQAPLDVLKQAGVTEQATPRKGDLRPGQDLILKQVEKPQEKPKGEILGGIDYRREVVHGTEMLRSRQATELDRKIQEIMSELKRLVDSSQVISAEYAQFAVAAKPTEAGKYHLNFFDFMLSVLRSARQKVEDSGAWLQVAKKKNGFHQKAQSLGTKFTMSHERTVATQTG